MRIIVHKIYRAFPELDRFTDEQCREYLAQVRRRYREKRTLLTISLVLAVGVLMPLTLGATAALGELLSPTLPARSRGFLYESTFFHALYLSVPTAVLPMLTALTIRNRWFRRRLREHMKEIRCAGCRYLLLGLVVRDGVVTCPECGEQIVLERMGLAPEDVMGIVAGTPLSAPPPATPDRVPAARSQAADCG